MKQVGGWWLSLEMKFLRVLSVGVACWCLGMNDLSAKELTLALAGDSTVARHSKPEISAGWGEYLADFLKPSVKVQNFAVSGTSSKSFRDKGYWTKLQASEADYVFLQFGHNDQPGKGPERETDPAGTYAENLTRYVEEVRARGGKPVLVTSVARRNFVNGVIDPAGLLPYVEATRRVAKAQQVPLIDLHASSVKFFNQKGEKFCKMYHPTPTDITHFTPAGARVIARLVAQELAQKLPELAPQVQIHPNVPADAPFTINLSTVVEGYDGDTCWVHARAGWIPSAEPKAILTMQKLLMKGSDIFFELNHTERAKGASSWSPLQAHTETLGRRQREDGLMQVICDFTPKYHSASGKLLGTGHTALYENGKVASNRDRSTAYAVYDETRKTWASWRTLKMPEEPQFFNSGAGCTQRVDLPNGEILLPVYHKEKDGAFYRSSVLRCRFDGEKLVYLSHGKEVALASGRGLYEPSLVQHQNKFYLTLRNDTSAYVTVSEDGLNYAEITSWKFDDGSELGNYNTQQHWLQLGEKLYLVYTRQGLHNDHVVRHRAPLLMAEVDLQTLRLKKATEVVVVPERGARLGNFGVTQVSQDEAWVTVTEWMQSHSPNFILPVDNAFGANNSVFVAKVRLKSPSAKKTSVKNIP